MITCSRLVLGMLALCASAGAAQAAAPALDAVATARCIADRLPQGAEVFRARDGSMRVVAIGRRGSIARWTITGSATDRTVILAGGPAGLARTVAGICY